MFKPVKISFDCWEIPEIAMFAERRNCGKQPNGVQNRKYDLNKTDFTVNYNGAMGEYAVAKYIDATIDKSIRLSGDNKISDLVKNNIQIQVKNTTFSLDNPFLFFNFKNLFKADIAVLTSPRSANEININGWITKEDFLNKAEEINFGRGARWAVQTDKLNDPKSLLQYLEIREEEFI